MQLPGGDSQWAKTWPRASFALGMVLVLVQVVQQLRGFPVEPTLLAAGLGLCGAPAFAQSRK